MTIDVREMTLYDHELRKRELEGPSNFTPGLPSVLTGALLLAAALFLLLYTQLTGSSWASLLATIITFISAMSLVLYGLNLSRNYSRSRRMAAQAHAFMVQTLVTRRIHEATQLAQFTVNFDQDADDHSDNLELYESAVRDVVTYGDSKDVEKLVESLGAIDREDHESSE